MNKGKGKGGVYLPPAPDNGLGQAVAGDDQLTSIDLDGDVDDSINQYTGALRAGKIDRFFQLAISLHTRLVKEKMVRDRSYHLKSYKKCIKGNDLVDWMVKSGECTSRVEAVAVGCSFIAHGE
jgi:hypothetical protein